MQIEDIFQFYHNEFKQKEQFLNDIIKSISPTAAITIDAEILASQGRLGFLFTINQSTLKEVLTDKLMEHGYSVLPFTSLKKYETDLLSKSFSTSIINEQPNSMTRDMTLFLKEVPEPLALPKTQYRFEFYPKQEFNFNKVISESTHLYMQYCNSTTTSIISKQQDQDTYLEPQYSNLKEIEICEDILPVKDTYYDIYRTCSGKIGINIAYYFRCWTKSHLYMVQENNNFYSNKSFRDGSQFVTYAIPETDKPKNITYGFCIEFSPTGNPTYNALGWEDYEYINQRDKCIVQYIKENLSNFDIREDLLYDLAKQLQKSRLRFTNSSRTLQDLDSANGMYLLWLRANKDQRIKDLSFSGIWEPEELHALNLHREPWSSVCSICNSNITRCSLNNKFICSKKCLDEYLKSRNGTLIDSLREWLVE